MGWSSSCFVELQICNRTQDTTLMEPRTYFGCGRCFKPLRPELSPGSSDTCRFWGDPLLWGYWGTTYVSGILVYEAKSFTLAIHFYNPSNHNNLSPTLGLELSPGKAHLGDLKVTFSRMAHGTYSSSDRDIEFVRVIVGESHGTIWVSHGPIKVMAAMSYGMTSTLKVVLEEEEESGEEAEGGRPRDMRGDRSKSSVTSRDILQDMMGSPGGLALLTMPLNTRPKDTVIVEYRGERRTLQGLLDTGADISIINLKCWPCHWPLRPPTKVLIGVGGEIRAKESPRLSVTIGGRTLWNFFSVVPLSIPVQCLIGRDILSRIGIVLTKEHPLG